MQSEQEEIDGIVIWRDPYNEPHTLHWADCPWCIITPTTCPICKVLIHNWYEDLTDDGKAIIGERCECGSFQTERGKRR